MCEGAVAGVNGAGGAVTGGDCFSMSPYLLHNFVYMCGVRLSSLFSRGLHVLVGGPVSCFRVNAFLLSRGGHRLLRC